MSEVLATSTLLMVTFGAAEPKILSETLKNGLGCVDGCADGCKVGCDDGQTLGCPDGCMLG